MNSELTSAQIFEYDATYGEPLIVEFISRYLESTGRTLDREITDSIDKSDMTIKPMNRNEDASA